MHGYQDNVSGKQCSLDNNYTIQRHSMDFYSLHFVPILITMKARGRNHRVTEVLEKKK